MIGNWFKCAVQCTWVALTTSILVASPIVDARAATQGIIGTAFESAGDARSCPQDVFCVVYFPAIPAGKVVRIEHATCNVSSISPLIKAYFSPHSANGSFFPIKPVAMRVEPVLSATNSYSFVVSLDTPLFVGAGRFPGVTVNQSAFGTLFVGECVIHGTVISG